MPKEPDGSGLIPPILSRTGLERSLFGKKDPLGRTLYFPSGPWGPGYVVATEEQRERILRGYIGTVYGFVVVFFIAAFIVTLLNLPPIALLIVVPFAPIAFALSSRAYVRGLEKSQTTQTVREHYSVTASFFKWPMLIALQVFLAVGFLLHVLVSVDTWSLELLIRTAFFGFGTIGVAYLIYVKYATRQDGG